MVIGESADFMKADLESGKTCLGNAEDRDMKSTVFP
jgi:hypothetical protein